MGDKEGEMMWGIRINYTLCCNGNSNKKCQEMSST